MILLNTNNIDDVMSCRVLSAQSCLIVISGIFKTWKLNILL